MKSLLQIALAAVLLISVPAAVLAGPDQSPGAVAANFINSYIRFLKKKGGGYEKSIAWVAARPDVTDDFRERLAKLYRDALEEDPQLGYGADAVIGGQDYPSGVRVKSSEIDEDEALVVLASTDRSFPMEVKVNLVRPEDRWLVDGSGDLADD